MKYNHTTEISVDVDKDYLLDVALDEFEEYRIHLLEQRAYSNLPEFKVVLTETAGYFATPEFKQRLQIFMARARALREALMAQPTN